MHYLYIIDSATLYNYYKLYTTATLFELPFFILKYIIMRSTDSTKIYYKVVLYGYTKLFKWWLLR